MQLLKDSPGELAAELAAVVLRNLASGNGAAQRAIVDAGGLWPLLSLLAGGAEELVYPMPCQARLAPLPSQGMLQCSRRGRKWAKCYLGKPTHAGCTAALTGCCSRHGHKQARVYCPASQHVG